MPDVAFHPVAGISVPQKGPGRRARMTHRPLAFTLVELLVVVALIAVVAAILVPVARQAREHALRAACTSNLRQIGLVLLMYETTYGQLPNGRFNVNNHIGARGQPGKPGYDGKGCHIAMRDRLGLREKVTQCPAADVHPSGYKWNDDGQFARLDYNYVAGWGNDDTDWGWPYGSTVWPCFNLGYKPTLKLKSPRRAPSDTLIMTDYILVPDRAAPSVPYLEWWNYGHWPKRSNHMRTSGFTAAGENVLFADQHVEWHPFIVGRTWWWGGPIYWTPAYPAPPYNNPNSKWPEGSPRYLKAEQ